MDVGVYDPKAQVKAVAAELKAVNTTRLLEAVDVMSTSLVMGLEGYLRKFDSASAIPLLADVCETFIREAAQGDLLVMALRALSLIMEHVPSSYEAAQGFHVSLMQLASQAIHRALCAEWKFVLSNNALMIEEGLRVMRFVSKDDMTGEIIHHAFVGDLLTLCTDPHPLVARQALETLLMMSSKVVMPSELEKRTHSFAAGIFSFFKSKKKSSRIGSDTGKAGHRSSSSGSSSTKAAATEDIVPYADHPTVSQVENVILPLLVSLIEHYAKSFTSIPEHWTLLELSLQCLGTLIERALICHRPHTARALASALLPKILFQLILDTESNVTLEPSVRVDRVLLCETTLTLLTYCHRYLVLESLQLPEARRFFRLILEDSTEEITTFLDDPFPRAVIATRSTQRRDKDHITSIAALQLFVLACPTVPPNAFGLKPKLVLPVHQWMWEDELRHNNRLMEEQCLSLERNWTRLDHHARISVHLKQLNVNLHTMTMSKAASGGHRNIRRAYVPFVYHFADEATLRPIVAVKEAGPCAEDGTMLAWKPTASTTHSSKTTASALIAKQVDDNASGSSSAKRSRRKCLSTSSLSEGEVMNTRASVPLTVVLNTQVEVPEDHILLAEEYFDFLCVFAKNTSGQMAKQVATCACASMLQLMFLSGASARFVGLMSTAVLPMCEMCREALISADKATKAVVLTMIEWMLFHPMAEPCQFTESALRCGLLNQLDILSKTTLVVHDKPTRTATLVEKAKALVGCILEKIENHRAAHTGGAGIHAEKGSKTTLGGGFLSTTMRRVQTVLDELRLCHCGAIKATVVDTSSSTRTAIAADKNGNPTRAIKGRVDTHESAIRELLRIFHESIDITPFEVFTADVASTLLYYLLGDRTLEDMLGDTLVFASGASASTSRRETVALPELHTGPIDRDTSSWSAMMASGMHVADILAMYVVEKRLRCFIQCAVAYPIGMRRLVHTLTANLSLQSYLPLVESVVTYDKVVCKTPLQAYHALSVISPLIALCGDAGRRISAAIKTSTDDDAVLPPRSSSSATVSGDSPAPAASSSNGTGTETKQRKTNLLASSFARSRAGSSRANDSAKAAHVAKECCMAGHRLHDMEHYPQLRRCDKCNRIISSGRSCNTCNYEVCQNCYAGYTGNLELARSLSTMKRNRVHLCATIGDLERWFRTGSTSTKGTESAPTSQSSLHHLERFTTRVLTFLKRYTVMDSSAVSIIPYASGATASNFLAFANPAARSNLPVELAEKLLSHPSVVRRLTYKYLSRFSTRGALMDEGTPIAPEIAASLDFEVQTVLGTAAERQAAERMVQEAVEERYILYRTSCGMLPFQETVLSTLYRRAFALGDRQVLLQLENCLLRADNAVDEPLALQANSSVTVANPAAFSSRFSANVKGTKKAKSLKSPLAVAAACSSSSAAWTAAAEPVMTSVEKSAEAREFDGHRVGLDQTYLFHHFESDSATHCACGAHSRAEFHTEEPPALTFTAPAFAHRADMLLLIILHRALFEETHGLIAYAREAKVIFGMDDSIFQNNTIITALVRSLEASALRVSLLPPRYALPRWVNFLLREGRFLIPLPVRERASRFLAYGARRAFIQHMRVFRSQRNDRALLIVPGEWAKLSNHKFAVSRDAFACDAYAILRKCCDARFPISFEFKGDVGVGQGPTAQFYTLLAAEASKCSTKLWRDSDDKTNGSSSNTAAVSNSSTGIVMAAGPLIVGPPPKSLPPRRRSITPITSPARFGTPRPGSFTNGAGGTVSTPRLGSIPTQSSLRNFVRADSAHLTIPSATLSPSLSITTAAEADAVLVPPPEGFYPRHMDGVRRYLEDIDSFPATPLLGCSHSHTMHDDSAAHALGQSGSEYFGSTTTRKGSAVTDVSTAGAGGHGTNSNSRTASAAQYDLRKAAFLVDTNVGLMRDYVLEQRERAKAYYVIGAALGRAFVDEQVFPLPLSRAVAYFIRRGVPAYQCVVSDVTHIDPPPEFPIDLFELPLTAASWVDQGIAESLACLSTMDSSTLSALDLRFTLPGDDSFELCPGGAQITVTKKNLRLYQRRVVGALLYESVAVPLYFLTMGCQDVVPHEALTVMDVKELIGVLCGEDKNPSDPLWTTEEILSVLVGDHGYRNDSPQLELLAKVLGQRLTPAEQREFLLFCTGCPRLPIGGIRALGAITVVRRSNAFEDERTEALQGEVAAATTSSSGGGGTVDMEGEEDDGGGGLMGRLYDHTAPSDVEDSPSGQGEAPRRIFSSVYPTASEEPGGLSSSFALHLPESEWALPSVNTCFRYLKLPPYPSEELLYKKLMMSIMESGSSFELS